MEKIFQVIENYGMIPPGSHVIAGISGGADSVCLLYVLAEYRKRIPFQVTAVHVEHGLRGEEALEDAAFTRQLCLRFGIPCRIVKAGVKQRAKEQGLSLEEAGRMERYRIFREVKQERGGCRIAVAHNQDDQAETVLWNLARGSGLRGLGGILPVREDVIRPLLFTRRREIEEILRRAGLSWRTDRTNLEQDYTRNRIRLSILPQMERELNGQSSAHIAQAAGRLQQVQAYVDRMTDRAAADCLTFRDGSVCIVLDRFREEDELIRRELLGRAAELCGNGRKDLGAVHIEALLNLSGQDCGKETCLPGGIRAVREKGILRFYRQEAGRRFDVSREGRRRFDISGEDRRRFSISGEGGGRSGASKGEPGKADPQSGEEPEKEISVPIPGDCRIGGFRIHTELLDNSPELMKEIIKEKKYTKWLSYDTIYGNVLFRTRRSGDYLTVNAQGGKKKLKDYFIDRKIPKDCRDRIWLLAEGSRVLWVPGFRISEDAKVLRETKKVIKIELEEENK